MMSLRRRSSLNTETSSYKLPSINNGSLLLVTDNFELANLSSRRNSSRNSNGAESSEGEREETISSCRSSPRPLWGSRRTKCTCRFLWNYELHGLTAFLRSNSLGGRIFWGVIITTCIVAAICTTRMVFDEYLERQTATLITIRQRARMLLPTVVVCPKNPDSLNYPLVLRDISKRLPHLDRVTLGKLIGFAIAGAGFHNMNNEMDKLSDMEVKRLMALFRRWQGRRSMEQFYTDLFERNGYKCANLFAACFYGYEEIPCCDVFRPYYVMLRGRCFRLDRFYQTDPDVFGRLNIYLHQMPSRLVGTSGMQPQVIIYVSDMYSDVGTFPRFYVNFHESVYMRLKARRIINLPSNTQCTPRLEYRGRASCFMEKWLRMKVVGPLNCTVFYLRHKFPALPVCEPEVVVRNYGRVNNLHFGGDNESNRCLPACRRTEYTVSLFRSESTILREPARYLPAFRVELSYIHLEMERYEEVVTTTLPGFVSQLGGQSGLFVGLSVCTIIQFGLSLARKGIQYANGYMSGHHCGGPSLFGTGGRALDVG